MIIIIIYPKTSKSLDTNSMKNIVNNQILQMKKSSSGSGAINNSRALYMASWDANSKKKEDKECWSNDKSLMTKWGLARLENIWPLGIMNRLVR